MNATATKVQKKLSDTVLEILENDGLGRLFNWIDYRYFRKESEGKASQATWIAEQFKLWNNHELSDFADYEF